MQSAVLPSPLGMGSATLMASFSKLNHPAHRCPYLRFDEDLAIFPARLRVRMDSLFFLSCRALSSPTTCRFNPGAPPSGTRTYNSSVNSGSLEGSQVLAWGELLRHYRQRANLMKLIKTPRALQIATAPHGRITRRPNSDYKISQPPSRCLAKRPSDRAVQIVMDGRRRFFVIRRRYLSESSPLPEVASVLKHPLLTEGL
jgi:hypothetical protein